MSKDFTDFYKSFPVKFYYQPIVDTEKEKVIGYEALARGKGRFSLPEEIFRFSYEQGFTVDFDLACMEKACMILPKLAKQEMLFINIEPITMSRIFTPKGRGLAFLKQIKKYAPQIVFELTEGMKKWDFENLQRGIRLIKKHGCEFAVDDVAGIGASVFKLLSLKPKFLKIDLGLIQGISKDFFQQEFVLQIITLALKSKAWVIAEGVERKNDMDMLRNLGVHYVQGYYWGRPHPRLARKLRPAKG